MGKLMATGKTVWGPKVPALKGTEAPLSDVQRFLYLVSSSINVFIFRITRLDTFWTALCYCTFQHNIILFEKREGEQYYHCAKTFLTLKWRRVNNLTWIFTQRICSPKLGVPAREPSSHRPSLTALLSADAGSHPQIKGGREGGRKRGQVFCWWISWLWSLTPRQKAKTRMKYPVRTVSWWRGGIQRSSSWLSKETDEELHLEANSWWKRGSILWFGRENLRKGHKMHSKLSRNIK